MKQTLKQAVEGQTDKKKRRLAQEEIAKAKRDTGRYDLDTHVTVDEVDTMGHVAGECHMCTKEIKIRRDLIDTESGIRESLRHVLIHEIHGHAEGENGQWNSSKNGIHFEGIAELATCLKDGKPPVAAYVEKTAAARHLAGVVGQTELIKTARREDAEAAITKAFVAKKAGKAANTSTVQSAQSEVKNLLKKAA